MVRRKPGRLDHLHVSLPSVAVRRIRLRTRFKPIPRIAITNRTALWASIAGNLDIANYPIELLETDWKRVTNLDDNAVARLQSWRPIFFALLYWSAFAIVAWAIQNHRPTLSALLIIQRWIDAGVAVLSFCN